MFLGKKGERMPASANSDMHGAYILHSVFLACFWIQCAAVVEWAFYRKDGTAILLAQSIQFFKRNLNIPLSTEG